MKIIATKKEMREQAEAWRKNGETIALVPTMGFLHEGHLSLMRIARKRAAKVVVSVFVNPTQFGPNEDYDRYPRDMEHDCKACEQEGVDVVFHPEPAEMYSPDRSCWVLEESLSQTLCGASRPTHFRGVTTVVTKLFNITGCNMAVFGKKDAQQALIIQRMVRDLDLPVEIILAPIVREPDGLAMSSRNTFLTADEHQRALAISRSLAAAERAWQDGETSAARIIDGISAALAQAGGRIDYVAVMARDTLRPIEIIDRPALVAVAVFFGKTRLIDNVFLG